MIVLDIAIAGCGFAFLLSAARIAVGPTPADRAIAADLLTFTIIGLVALIGTKSHSEGTFDLIIVATLVAFLASVSLARAITRGQR
jgi:multicomponent Na+:H+ antiporter subunit F